MQVHLPDLAVIWLFPVNDHHPENTCLCAVVQLVQFGLNAVNCLFNFGLSGISRVSSCRHAAASSSNKSWFADLLLESFVHCVQGGLKVLEVLSQTLDLLLHLPHLLTLSPPWKKGGSNFRAPNKETFTVP